MGNTTFSKAQHICNINGNSLMVNGIYTSLLRSTLPNKHLTVTFSTTLQTHNICSLHFTMSNTSILKSSFTLIADSICVGPTLCQCGIEVCKYYSQWEFNISSKILSLVLSYSKMQQIHKYRRHPIEQNFWYTPFTFVTLMLCIILHCILWY